MVTSELNPLHQALEDHQTGRIAEASQRYREIIEREPENVDALHLFGLLNHEQGDSEQAIELISRAIVLHPNSGVLHNSLGVAQLELRKIDSAIESFRQAVLHAPQLRDAHRNLGIAFQQRGMPDDAKSSLEEAIRLEPNNPQTHLDLGDVARECEDWWAAEASYRQAIGCSSEADWTIKASVALSNLLNLQNRPADAIEVIEPIVAAFPDQADVRLQLGVAQGRMGRDEEAVQQLRSAFELDKSSIPICFNLSVSLLSLGKAEESLPHAERAAAESPVPKYQRHLAAVLKSVGRFDESMSLMEKLRSDAPDDLDLREEIAELEFQRGNVEQAVKVYREILEADSSRRRTLLKLARICEQSQRVDQTVETCVRILRQDPNSVGAHLLLGMVLSSRIAPEHRAKLDLDERDDLRDRALTHLQRAATLDPSPETFDAWGRTLLHAGRHEEAIQRLEQSVKLKPDFAPSHEHLGKAWLELGKLDAAKACFESAIQIRPQSSEAQYELARIDGSDQPQEKIDSLISMLDSKTASDHEQMMLHFTVARRLDANGDANRAFDHYSRGNELKTTKKNQKRGVDKITTDELIRVFSKAYFAKHQGSGSESDLPVFIVGMPRSGTTLVEQIISSHPSVFGAGELSDLSDLVVSLPRRTGKDDDYPDIAKRIDATLASALADEYLARLERVISASGNATQRESITRVTDKMPINFRHLGLVGRLFPKATVIHVRRDPMDVCVSCFKQNLAWPFCDLKAVAEYYHQYKRLMNHWRTVVPNPIHDIQYEDLVRDQSDQSRQLVEACGLEWDDACLDFANSDRAVQTPSKWQVRQPIYHSSVGAWRKYESRLEELQRAFESEDASRDA